MAPRRRRSPARAGPQPSAEVAALEARLTEARSRGAVKALGRAVDEDPELRARLEALATARGVAVDPTWTGKKLVRAARDREAASRVRTNPIRRDQAFVCLHCGEEVSAGGGHVRDHCPRCLRSRHVDEVPGDRAAACGGLYDPVGFERAHGEIIIRYTCRACGVPWRGRAHADDQVPPDFDVAALPGPATLPADSTGLGAVQKRARTLPLRVLDHIRRHRLWEKGDTVLVAVSGGLDSTVLLELLVELGGGHGGRLQVASVDHGLRPEAAQEVARVGRRARALGLPFHPLSLSLPPGHGLAARARVARWAALEAIGADRIATGHHRDDQTETVLQHLVRGSGLRGLRGMRPSAGRRVRPLLAEPRAVVHRWAEDRGLSWVDDPSNAATERGRIRSLMPQLEALRAGAARGLARSARLLARDEDLLEALADDAWATAASDGRLELEAWTELHPAMQLRLLLRLVEPVPHGVAVRADQLERLLDGPLSHGSRFGLSGGYAIAVCDGSLVLVGPSGQ